MSGCDSGRGCAARTILITACSGAANTGSIADQVARALRAREVGSMTCLAGLGAGLPSFVESARGADRNIVIDGCPAGCGSKVFAGLEIPCEAYVVTDFGVEKGSTPVTPELVSAVASAIARATEEAGL